MNQNELILQAEDLSRQAGELSNHLQNFLIQSQDAAQATPFLHLFTAFVFRTCLCNRTGTVICRPPDDCQYEEYSLDAQQ